MQTTSQKTVIDLNLEERYGAFINGEFVEPSNGYIDAINAANGKLLSKIARCGKEEVDLAVQAANEAFKGWSNTPIEQRSALLQDRKSVV